MNNKMIGCVSAMTMAGVMAFGGFQVPAMAATGGNDGVVRFQKVLEMQKAAGANVLIRLFPGAGLERQPHRRRSSRVSVHRLFRMYLTQIQIRSHSRK